MQNARNPISTVHNEGSHVMNIPVNFQPNRTTNARRSELFINTGRSFQILYFLDIDWLNTFERIFNFKDIPDEKKVKLVAIRLTRRAFAGWVQLKMACERSEKGKITSWEKMKKKKLRKNFLPFYYVYTLYYCFRRLANSLT
jgi:hypothetical protein